MLEAFKSESSGVKQISSKFTLYCLILIMLVNEKEAIEIDTLILL